MKIYLGTDHAGFELKEAVKKHLTEKGYAVEDCGAFTYNPDDDYPNFVAKAAQAVSENPDTKGIVFGGSGEAEAIVANKFPHIRAGLFYGPVAPVGPMDVAGATSTDPFTILKLNRLHNDANVLSIGARFLTEQDALHAVDIWLETAFSNDERHKRRIAEIAALEETKSTER